MVFAMKASQPLHSGVLSPDGQVKPPESCVACERADLKVWTCVQCGHFTFCDDCWGRERPHKPGVKGIDNRPHEKVDSAVVERLERIFGEGRTKEEQAELFDTDADTMWFGVNRSNDGSFLDHSDRLIEIMLEGEGHEYSTSERFPQLVSFVGKTGEGKSTVIKMLIGREQASVRASQTRSLAASKSFPAPVNGLTDDPISTSGDVHLYADPATHHESHPVLFADCEGLGGGESAPRAKEYQANSKSARRRKIQQRLRWAKDSMTSSRGFAVKRLFPRILYTFSDVIVFVIQEARTFQSDVLVNLVEWAYFSIEKAVNQPVLPHLIIALNRTDNAIDEEQWDTGIATDKLLGAHEDITQVPELISIVQGLRRTGQNVKSAKELLECFYRSITVVRIPTKGRYMQIDNQIGKLYATIRDKGTISHTEKKSVRMALNAEKLHQFMNAAYDHFSDNLNQPFDFVKEALLLNPMPHDFQGHMLHLIIAVRNGISHVAGTNPELRLLKKVKPLLASYMTLIITRNNLTGKIKDLLDGTFRKPARMAFEELCDKWLPCGFQSKGLTCCNVRYAHVKGHQASNGKIFQKGDYQPIVTDDQFEGWFRGIGAELESMMDELPHAGSEKENAWGKHLRRLEWFYEDNSKFSETISHGTCFCCINNVPEHVLPCGHVICTECITALGGQMEQNILFIKYCPFHRQKHNWERNPVQIRFKPDGAGIRALCLDGGGVRGLIELIMLEELQKQLNGIPVQNFFDLIVGTSTGGIVALGLGVRNLSVSDCIRDFKDLCGKAFTPRTLKRLWSSWYKTKPLKEGVQRVFGANDLLFGGASDPNSPRSHIKVAVTTSLRSGKSNKAILLTNYNVTGQEREKCRLNYDILRSTRPKREIKVWEAALATSAAPPYFKPYIQPATGKSFVDGGLHYNCPAWVVHHERQILWKDVQHQQPDILLSLGTGLGRGPVAATQVPQPTKGGFVNLINIIRGIVQNQLNSEQAWYDYYAGVTNTNLAEDRQRHIRLNVLFEGVRPGLDKADQLDQLEARARTSARVDPKIRDAADRLVASSFYFEREGPVTKGRSSTGSILCRFDPGSNDIKKLGLLLLSRITGDFEPHFIFQADHNHSHSQGYENKIPVSREVWSEMGTSGRFRAQVEVPARAHTGLVRIALALRPPPPHQSQGSNVDPYISISGFPRQLYDENTRRPMSAHSLDGDVYTRRSDTSLTLALSPLARADDSPKLGATVSTESAPAELGTPTTEAFFNYPQHHRARSGEF